MMSLIATTGSSPLSPARRGLGQIFSARTLTMVLVFLALALVFNVASGDLFLTPRNLSLLLRQAAIVALVAAGVSILMVMGQIDLSIGSSVYLCGVVAATLQISYGLDVVSTVLITVAAGILMGLWQGLWVVTVGVPSFIVTLAGLLAYRGIGYYATDAATLAPVPQGFSALSEAFIPIMPSIVMLLCCYAIGAILMVRSHFQDAAMLGQAKPAALAGRLLGLTATVALLLWICAGFRGIPTAVIWVAVIGVVLWVLMTKTVFGRNAYLTGANQEAAVLAGIPLSRQLYVGFMLMGALYGVAGSLMTARVGASTPTAGLYLELDAIAGAVIGGTALKGGIGTVPGAIIGAVLLTTIDNGMSILNISSFLQLVIKGMVLLFALAVDSFMTRRQGRR